jgi:hypothetical protein
MSSSLVCCGRSRVARTPSALLLEMVTIYLPDVHQFLSTQTAITPQPNTRSVNKHSCQLKLSAG